MLAKIIGTGDGSAPVVNLTFPFITRAHVKAAIGETEVGFSWTGDSQITFDDAVDTGAEWSVYRRTPTEKLVDFTDGSILTEVDLDLLNTQLVYLHEELEDAKLSTDAKADKAIRLGDTGADLDPADYLGKFMLVNADGDVVPSTGTGNDTAFRADLAASTGLSLVGTPSGRSLRKLLDTTPRALSYGARAGARTYRDVIAASETISSQIVGYAAEAGTTGGDTLPIYYVDSGYTDASIPNSIGWALAKAKVGGGRIIFDPRHKIDVLVLDDFFMRFNAGQDNITMIAPGRNVTFWFTPLTSGALIQSKNMIFAYIEFRTLMGSIAAEAYGVTGKVEHKLVSVSPQLADKLAFIGCEFRHSSDGALDMSATTLTEASPLCRVTVQDFLFWDTDQAMLLGANDVTAGLSSTTKLFVTLYNGVYAYNGERQPKVLGRTFVDMVDVYTLTMPFKRDNLAPISEFSVNYGTEVALGGKLRARGCMWAAPLGDGTQKAVGVLEGYIGAIDVEDSVAEGMIFEKSNEGLIPTPTYVLAHTPVPVSSGQPREDWIADRWASAGARPDAAPAGLFVWLEGDETYPNGETVLLDRGPAGTFLDGRLVRVDRATEAPPVRVPRSGTYVPTFTNIANLASATNANAFWQRSENGDYITVEGSVDLTTTIAGDTQFTISLPIESDLTATSDATGALVCYRGANITGGAIIGRASDNTALARPFTGSTAALTYTFRFTYKVK